MYLRGAKRITGAHVARHAVHRLHSTSTGPFAVAGVALLVHLSYSYVQETHVSDDVVYVSVATFFLAYSIIPQQVQEQMLLHNQTIPYEPDRFNHEKDSIATASLQAGPYDPVNYSSSSSMCNVRRIASRCR